MKMLHNQMQKQLSAYLDDELSPRQKRQVEQHLLICGECSSLLQELRDMSAGVASLRQTAPEDLWFAINEQLEGLSSDSTRTLARERRWTWRGIHPIIKPVAVAIGIALVALGVFQVFLNRPAESPQYPQMEAYLAAYTQYYSQNVLASDPIIDWEQQSSKAEPTQQNQQSNYSPELDFYISVYLGDEEI